jgi:hypothetical protein
MVPRLLERNTNVLIVRKRHAAKLPLDWRCATATASSNDSISRNGIWEKSSSSHRIRGGIITRQAFKERLFAGKPRTGKADGNPRFHVSLPFFLPLLFNSLS